jgi:hypothetical protein
MNEEIVSTATEPKNGSEDHGIDGQEKQTHGGEMLLGLDVEPQVGQRVHMAVGFIQIGDGTVVFTSPDGGSAAVKWDSGVEDRRLLTGQDGVYALALIDGKDSTTIPQGYATSDGSEEWET